jgi:hypothetical protein
MVQNSPYNPRLFSGRFFTVVLLFTCLALQLNAQQREKKNSDYILLMDTVHFSGYIEKLPSKAFTEIKFKKFKNAAPSTYGIDEISEFRYNDRVFFRRTVDGVRAFLEYLPTDNPNFRIYRRQGQTASYYIENLKSGELKLLDENYKEILSEELDNPLVANLIALTNRNEFSLPYLLQNDHVVTKPRTFSKPISIIPFVGTGAGNVQIPIVFQNATVEQSMKLLSGGIGVEAFPNFRRNLSVSFMPYLAGFNSTAFHSVTVRPNEQFETDISLTWIGVQLPLSGRYYFDLKPQQLRVYAEIGYTLSMTLSQQSSQTGALVKPAEVQMDNRPVSIAEQHRGMVYGLGFDMITYWAHIGIKSNALTGQKTDSKINFLNIQIGYRF